MSSTNERLPLAGRLIALRKQCGMNQEDFARSLGISKRAYQNYERGDRDVSVELIRALIRERNTDPVWLLTGESSKQVASTPAPAQLVPPQIDDRIFAEVFTAFAQTGGIWVLSMLEKVARLMQDVRIALGSNDGHGEKPGIDAGGHEARSSVDLGRAKPASDKVAALIMDAWTNRELVIALWACRIYNEVATIENPVERSKIISKKVREVLGLIEPGRGIPEGEPSCPTPQELDR